MVELRKRKAPPPPPVAKKSKTTSKVTKKPPAAPKGKTAAKSSGKLDVGHTVDLSGDFGGKITTADGTSTSLSELVGQSKAGVVIFTYPKASTPGCTTQVCLFRDNYAPLTATGFDVYGLSTDSPKANTTFKTKQNLPYALLCDPKSTLIAAIGLKKSPTGTQRGVVVIDKAGKVLLAEAGGPEATLLAAKKVVPYV